MEPKVQSTEKQVLPLVRVRFWGNPTPHTFIVPEGFPMPLYGQIVYARSDTGKTLGVINSLVFEKKVSRGSYPEIIRLASKEDKQLDIEAQKKAQGIKIHCINEVKALQLEMFVSHVTPIDFGKKMIIYFTAPAPVDFRALVSKLRSKGHKIELRHINDQRRMEALGVLGSCGHTTSEYLRSLKKYEKRNFSVKRSFSRVS